MNKHLQQRVRELLTRYETASLATCGQAGPQIMSVPYRIQQLNLYLFVPHGSDHLFNLETQPELVLLSPEWELHGRGHEVAPNGDIAPLHTWQVVVSVQPVRLHILTTDGSGYSETIDFE